MWDERYFPSKRDGWLVALIWAGALVAVAAGVGQLGSATGTLPGLLMGVLLIGMAAFLLWVLYGTGYTLTADRLLIRSGPFRFRVPLAEIDSVTPSRNPLSSPACSLDRLDVRYHRGRRRILISPEDKGRFLGSLVERCPRLILAGEAARAAG